MGGRTTGLHEARYLTSHVLLVPPPVAESQATRPLLTQRASYVVEIAPTTSFECISDCSNRLMPQFAMGSTLNSVLLRIPEHQRAQLQT